LKLDERNIYVDYHQSKEIEELSRKQNSKPPTNDYLLKLTNLLKNKDDKYVEKRRLLENSLIKNKVYLSKEKDVYLTMHNKISAADTKHTTIPLVNETVESENVNEKEDSKNEINTFKSFGIVSLSKNQEDSKLGNIAGIPEFRQDYICLMENNFPVEDKSFESWSNASRESEDLLVNENEKKILFKKIRNKEIKLIQNLKEKENLDKNKLKKKDKVESFLDTSSRVKHIKMVTQKMRFINNVDKVLPPLPIQDRNYKVLKQKDVNYSLTKDNYLNKFKIFDEKRKKNLNELIEKINSFKSSEKNNLSFLKQATINYNTYTDENDDINFF